MSLWGKIIGGVAGFAVGGPVGAMVGAALGHAAENGARTLPALPRDPAASLRIAALLGRREELYALCVVVLSAKLAKCDGAISRGEIDAFKRQFRVPPEAVRDVGRLFDEARDSAGGPEAYADQLGAAFADNPGLLEGVLTALFGVARADGQVNAAEMAFLQTVCVRFGLPQLAWDRARGAVAARAEAEDPYAVLGVAPGAAAEELRASWLKLVRENHPDSVAGTGAAPDLVARAGERVAKINAAWDRIKRERGL